MIKQINIICSWQLCNLADKLIDDRKIIMLFDENIMIVYDQQNNSSVKWWFQIRFGSPVVGN